MINESAKETSETSWCILGFPDSDSGPGAECSEAAGARWLGEEPGAALAGTSAPCKLQGLAEVLNHQKQVPCPL